MHSILIVSAGLLSFASAAAVPKLDAFEPHLHSHYERAVGTANVFDRNDPPRLYDALALRDFVPNTTFSYEYRTTRRLQHVLDAPELMFKLGAPTNQLFIDLVQPAREPTDHESDDALLIAAPSQKDAPVLVHEVVGGLDQVYMPVLKAGYKRELIIQKFMNQTAIPDGHYHVSLRALTLGADPEKLENWDIWVSPDFRVERKSSTDRGLADS